MDFWRFALGVRIQQLDFFLIMREVCLSVSEKKRTLSTNLSVVVQLIFALTAFDQEKCMYLFYFS